MLIDKLKKEEFLQHTPTPTVTDNKNKFNMNNENNLLNENKAYLIIALSNMCFALLVFHIKLTRRFLKSDFNLNMFILWRGLFLSVMGYIQMKKKNIKDYSFASINSKNWFIIRTLANYFNFFTQILTVTYLRTATAACISSLYPVFVVIVSVLILKEKYYHRYIIGIFICIFGTSIIVLNERGPDSITSKQETNIFLGCLFGCLNVLTMTIVVVGGKALLNAGIENEIQQLYIGGVNFSFSLILLILTSTIDMRLSLFLNGFISGFIFYIALELFQIGIKVLDVNKTTPFVYVNPLTVFILGAIFLSDPIYLTDLIGCSIILSYNIWNCIYPVKK